MLKYEESSHCTMIYIFMYSENPSDSQGTHYMIIILFMAIHLQKHSCNCIPCLPSFQNGGIVYIIMQSLIGKVFVVFVRYVGCILQLY